MFNLILMSSKIKIDALKKDILPHSSFHKYISHWVFLALREDIR